MAKPCKHCGMYGHSTVFCWARPKQVLAKRKPVKKIGPVTSKWLRVRAEWFKENPADDGFYICYICGDRLTPKETTLDHIKPRSLFPELRFELSNLAPCCYRCNREKGSKVLDIKEFEGNGKRG